MVYDSPDVYDPPPGCPSPKLPRRAISGVYTRNMLENRPYVTRDTDTVGDMDKN